MMAVDASEINLNFLSARVVELTKVLSAAVVEVMEVAIALDVSLIL